MENIEKTIRTVRIAANHAHALPLIEAAAAKGAQLVVLPELFACGYVPNSGIWRYGETLEGPTVAWSRETSRRLGIYLGAGFLEIEDDEFFNSFALTDPEGELLGCMRKSRSEVYCFRYGVGRHVVHSDLGTVGVGICADNHFTGFPELMHRHGRENALNSRVVRRLARYSGGVRQRGRRAATDGGIARKVHHPGGFSRVVDSDGTVLGELGEEEGLIVANITLDPSQKMFHTPPDYDGWLHPGSKVIRKILFPVDLAFGRLYYALSRKRRRAAAEGARHEGRR